MAISQKNTIITIKDATACQLPLVYKLYMEAFPKEERKPFELIQQKVKERQMEILVIEKNKTFVGLAITAYDKEKVLLDYFAIEASYRGQEIGGKAIEMLKQRYAKKVFFLEIEIPDEKREDYETRMRRKTFYLKHGLKETKVYVDLFGVEMEILTASSEITFEAYLGLYQSVFGQAIDQKIKCISFD